MTTVEIKTLREQAQKDLGKVNKKEGLLASPEGQPFSALFGRDVLIISLISLDLLERYKNQPDLEILDTVKRNLFTLAENQGKVVNLNTEEEPGKIEHENRTGIFATDQKRLEMLKRGGWPVESAGDHLYMRYWGSVDATPLFVVTLGEYFKVSHDWEFLGKIKENGRAALRWMENFGDIDSDEFIEYSAKNRNALINQGWKDSDNSVLTKDGKHPTEPIALVEVQGYAYWAYNLAATLFDKTGEVEFASHLRQKATTLREKFNRDFWVEDEQFFAHALDGDKKQIKDVVSNVGHLLISGILDREQATRVVKRLMQPDMLTKYGIRTLSTKSPHFRFSETDFKIQKQAYHNGSIWPHDNAVIALGLKKYGFDKEARIVKYAVLSALSKLNGNFELYQVTPDGQKLVPYAGAAIPQTWVAAAVLLWTSEGEQIVEYFKRMFDLPRIAQRIVGLKAQIFNQ